MARPSTQASAGVFIRAPIARHDDSDTQVVLRSPGLALSWEETSGRHGATVLVGQPIGARLHEAIQAALASATVTGT